MTTIPSRPTRRGLSLFARIVGGASVRAVQRGLVRSRFRRAGLRERTLRVGNATVHLWEGGMGRPLVLLHGFGGDATWTWHPNVTKLAKVHRLIAPDLLYFGRSDGGRADYSLDHQAEVLVAALDQCHVASFDVVGISYGGFVAWTMAQRWPDRVGRVVLVTSPGPVFSDDDHAKTLARFGVADLAQVVLPDGPDGVRRLIELAWYRPPPTPKFVLEYVHAHLFTDRVEEKRQLLRWLDLHRDRIRSGPWRIPQPTLLVWGAHDPLFPVSLAIQLSAILADARLVVLPRARHAPNLEHPEAFAEALRSFLAEDAVSAARAAG